MLERRRFDVHEFERMLDAGVLLGDDRVELIDGEIVRMHPVGPGHVASVNRLTALLVTALQDRAIVSIQNAVLLDDYNVPKPDVALLEPRDDWYAAGLPRPEDVRLLIEVARSSLAYDRTVKAALYAQLGVREYWIVDLDGRALDVYREPDDGEYGVRSRVEAGTVSPLAFPDLEIGLEEILPPPTPGSGPLDGNEPESV